MVRPKKNRTVSSVPNITYFKPAGIPLRFLTEVRLSVEEGEALRLKELENLSQIESAKKMGVSRPTFQRVLASARKKVADALLNGKAIRIEGGNFELSGVRAECPKGHKWPDEKGFDGEGGNRCPFCKLENGQPGEKPSPPAL